MFGFSPSAELFLLPGPGDCAAGEGRGGEGPAPGLCQKPAVGFSLWSFKRVLATPALDTFAFLVLIHSLIHSPLQSLSRYLVRAKDRVRFSCICMAGGLFFKDQLGSEPLEAAGLARSTARGVSLTCICCWMSELSYRWRNWLGGAFI